MPLALTIRDAVRTLQTAVKSLTPWLQIVPREETIVERARGAFLVHWFGRQLPFAGLSLRAYIVNGEELQQRYLLARRSVPSSRGGPNLTEGVLGLVGTLAGMVLSPAGLFIAAVMYHRITGASGWVIVGGLVAAGLALTALVVAPTATVVLLGGGAAGFAGLYALALGLGDRRGPRALYDLFGSLARLMDAMALFLGQLTGPRDQVRNPLLRRILDFGDQLSALLAQGLGFVAIVVRRVAPIMAPVTRMLLSLSALATATMGALSEVMSGMFDQLRELDDGSLSFSRLATRVIAVATERYDRIVGVMDEVMTEVLAVFTNLGTALGAAFDHYWTNIKDLLTSQVKAHPVGIVISALLSQVDTIKAAFAAVPPKPPRPPGAPPPPPGRMAPMVAALPALPPLPPFPPFPALPDAAAVSAAMGGASIPPLNIQSIEAEAAHLGSMTWTAPIELGPDAQAALDRAIRRPSVFGPERRALDARFGGSAAGRLGLDRAELGRMRDLLAVVVGQILPPEMQVYRQELIDLFTEVDDQLDRLVTGRPAAAAAPAPPARAALPDARVPTTYQLRPSVKRLRLRIPGAHITDVRRFEGMVRERLLRQPYTADVPVGAT
jgi:hypothetical protein